MEHDFPNVKPSFTAYLRRSPSMLILQKLDERLCVYSTLDRALKDEHKIVSLCNETGHTIDLVRVTEVTTILRINSHGRITGQKNGDRFT